MICITGYLRFKSEQEIGYDDAQRVITQVSRDATFGTYGDYPDYYSADKWRVSPKDITSARIVGDRVSCNQFRFEIQLIDEQVDVARGGFQHLIGILAGDLLRLRIRDLPPFEFKIDEVNLPREKWDTAEQLFRQGPSNSISSIIKQFESPGRPLLAFSFKPRLGLDFDSVREITLGVLRAGFNIVELDTRNLLLGDDRINQLLQLAEESAALAVAHVTRFSPNLSLPGSQAVELVHQFSEVQEAPIVVKVDGGLDGISTCQEIRRQFPTEENDVPIITCYPLLRSQLKREVPSSFFVRTLAYSGADIIYPGGRPPLDSGVRDLGTAGEDRLIQSVQRYRKIVQNDWPMPTIAGGVNAGQLHAFYELLGPRVAFFLGGAVALHKNGPISGAKLCADVIREAVSIRREDSDAEVANDLDDALIQRLEEAYEQPDLDPVDFRYLRPSTVIQVAGLRSWFRDRS